MKQLAFATFLLALPVFNTALAREQALCSLAGTDICVIESDKPSVLIHVHSPQSFPCGLLIRPSAGPGLPDRDGTKIFAENIVVTQTEWNDVIKEVPHNSEGIDLSSMGDLFVGELKISTKTGESIDHLIERSLAVGEFRSKRIVATLGWVGFPFSVCNKQ